MSKKIHAIKCPQCDSAEKTAIKENHYRCESCGTDYFLESNDVKVTHYHHHYESHKGNIQTETISPLLRNILIAAAGVILTLGLVFSFSDSGKRTKSRSAVTHTGGGRGGGGIFHREGIFFTGQDKKTLLLVETNDTLNGPILTIYDPEAEKILAQPKPGKRYHRLQFKQFDSGEIYMLAQENIGGDPRDIYRLETSSLSLTHMNPLFEKAQPALSKGIATAKFSHDGDGFSVMTNVGEKFDYFPYSNKTFTEEEERAYLKKGMTGVPADTAVSSAIVFTALRQKDMFAKDSDQFILMEYRRKTPLGYPREAFTSHTAHRIMNGERERDLGKIIQWRNVLPNRTFFKPDRVLCNNDKYAMIEFHESVLQDSQSFLQLIELNTGNPLWTRKAAKETRHSRYCAVTPEGVTYFYESYRAAYSGIIARDGKVSKAKKWIQYESDKQEVPSDVGIVTVY